MIRLLGNEPYFPRDIVLIAIQVSFVPKSTARVLAFFCGGVGIRVWCYLKNFDAV